nr:MAG TPA: hypothetical protein [Caudoviricetes sp.]
MEAEDGCITATIFHFWSDKAEFPVVASCNKNHLKRLLN